MAHGRRRDSGERTVTVPEAKGYGALRDVMRQSAQWLWERRRGLALLVTGFLGGAAFMGLSVYAVHATSEDEFCLSCHEMRYVAEQGWMHSAHYVGEAGVVAHCADCHVPPGIWPTLWTKLRDGSKDVYAHLFGESDPAKMDWPRLRRLARSKVRDSACRRCHGNLTSSRMGLKAIMAHRQYLRGLGHRRCLDCHAQGLHGRYLETLAATSEP